MKSIIRGLEGSVRSSSSWVYNYTRKTLKARREPFRGLRIDSSDTSLKKLQIFD